MFDFVLADRMRCSVEELRDRVSSAEWHKWRHFYTARGAARDHEREMNG